MNNYIDELFLKEVGKIASKYGGEIIYGNILTRRFWVSCLSDVEEDISFEIEALVAAFKNNYSCYNFEDEKIFTREGWPVNIGDIIR